MKVAITVLVSIFVVINNLSAEGFLKTDGKKIVDEQGNEIILRAMGLGGWMVQEGYMLQTSSFAGPQHKIRAHIEELIGTEKTQTFYDAWLANHTRKIDIDSLAAWGFNSVRVPLHYNLFTLPIEEEPTPGLHTWLDTGFVLTDSLLNWCAENKMYLILDLHAAPGGQGKDAAISDYDDTKPSLWESADNRAKTIALWQRLATRYANEPWIAGYDLLNETNWPMSNNDMLKQLYRNITNFIRTADKNHIIFIEGNWFANDFTGLTPPWDDNMVYSFHKYWSNNDQGSIQWMLNMREEYNIPIWCGESGENSNTWFTDAIRLFEQNNIGWAWWPLKKVESISGPLSIPKNADYQILLDYWEGRATRPSEQFSFNALMQLAEDLKLENCTFNKDVVDAMTRQITSNETKPFKENSVPGKIFATDFDMGRNEYAYLDKVVGTYQVSTGNYTAWNDGWGYRNDGVDIEPCQDSESSNGYNVGWTEDGEWLKYTIHTEMADSFKLNLRVASNSSNGQFRLSIDELAGSNISVTSTGGWQDWETIPAGNFYLTAGSHSVKLEILKGVFNINFIEFIGQNLSSSGSYPGDFKLFQNGPNPFNPSTTIRYHLKKGGDIKLNIYDSLGRLVKRIVRKNLPEGSHEEQFQSTGLAAGIYYSQLLYNGKSQHKKMILLP
ncbi:MAG: carbohydrate-binding protein [Calditrichaeota bacterium]|nr:carbohydrate-binding protein [Calditrichota bacterium]NOG45021.1 cellulase family glycosylhydrolase [Calditrichota bacterium]